MNVELRMMNFELGTSPQGCLVRHTLPVRHSRAGGNLTESTVEYPAGTVASVPGTGDSCLRRSDVKAWENIED